MVTYLLRRLFQSLLFVLLAGLLIYTTLVMLIPEASTPATRYTVVKQMIRDHIDPPPGFPDPIVELEGLEQKYKLDKPWPLSFLFWLFDPKDTEVTGYDLQGNLVTTSKGMDVNVFGMRLRGSGILTGDFGTSTGFAGSESISRVFADRWVNTAVLVAASAGLALLIGLPLGIFGALRQRTTLDNVLTVFTLSGLSIPAFVLGLILIIFLAVIPKSLRDQNGWIWLPWLPSGDLGDTGNFWGRVRHLVLPAVTLSIPQIAWLSQYTRFAMLDVLHQDYIRTAWAKGLSTARVVFKHALRNTLIPLITQVALILPALVSSALVVETVFAYEGLGRVFFRAMGGCLSSATLLTQEPRPCPTSGYWPVDTPFALVLLLIMVAIVAISNLIADLLYVIADPRISYASDTRST